MLTLQKSNLWSLASGKIAVSVLNVKHNKHKTISMKKITYYLALKIAMLFLFGFINTFVFAQDTTSHSVTTTHERTITTINWYMQPWVWVVGGAVFIIILIALFRGNRKVEVTRTTVIKNDKTV